MTMTSEGVQRWLDAYVDAWRTYDPDAIGALFAEDATYAYQPYREPTRGRAAIIADWLDSPDEAGTWAAHYEPFAVEGDRAASVGTSDYLRPDGSLRTRFHNVFLLRFDGDGRVAEFIEYWREAEPGEA